MWRRRGCLRYLSPAAKWAQYKKIMIQPVTFWGQDEAAFAFATGLSTLTPGQWQGSVPSGYGVHVVYISERMEGRIPKLADVREAVRREWANARRLEANETFYQTLLRRYTVTIERPQPAGEEKSVAEVRR